MRLNRWTLIRLFSLFRCLRFLLWFRPNFSHHPLNYIFALIIFLLSFVSTDIFADYNPLYCWTTDTTKGWTSASACQQRHPQTYHSVIVHSEALHQCVIVWNPPSVPTNATGMVSRRDINSEQCNNIAPYDPPNNCPSAGTSAGNVGVGAGAVGAGGNLAGCYIQPVWVDVECDADFTAEFPHITMCKTRAGYEFTGEPAVTGAPEISESDMLFSDPITDPLGVLPSVSETSVDRQFESWPDGTTSEIVTTTTNEIRGAGSERLENETITVIQYSNGIQQIVTETITTVTHPDGSKTITTDVNRTFNSHSPTTISINKNEYTVTYVDGSVTQTSSTDTTVDSYDSTGNLTGSSKTSTGSGTGLGGGSGSGNGDGDGEDGFEGSSFGQCLQTFSCTGDLFECHLVRTQHEQFCLTLESWNTEDLPLSVDDFLNDLSEQEFPVTDDEVLEAITDEIDVNDWFVSTGLSASLSNPSGREGSCPSDIPLLLSFTSAAFDWSFICQFAVELRPLVLFATFIMCFYGFLHSCFGIRLRFS